MDIRTNAQLEGFAEHAMNCQTSSAQNVRKTLFLPTLPTVYVDVQGLTHKFLVFAILLQ
jgi:hypothetical protein